MKKVLPLAIALLFIGTFVNAQIEKGSVLLGGNIGFGNSKNENSGIYKQNYLVINPTAGVAVKTNLVAGITVTYGHFKNFADSLTGPQDNTTLGSSIFLRRYFPVAKNFYVFGQGNLGYNHYHSKEENTDYFRDFVSHAVSIDVAPGLAYAVTKRFHLELGLGNLVEVRYETSKLDSWKLKNYKGSCVWL